MSKLAELLNNPLVKTLILTRPELSVTFLAIEALIFDRTKTFASAISVIDDMAADLLKRLLDKKLHPLERDEIEIRLHELLKVMNRLGEL